jgi:hypothetical protein
VQVGVDELPASAGFGVGVGHRVAGALNCCGRSAGQPFGVPRMAGHACARAPVVEKERRKGGGTADPARSPTIS